jgi:Otopetrin
MGRHKVIARFGLMHMVATNLCEWLYTLVEETKHEIWHLSHLAHADHSTPNGHVTHEAFTENIANNSTLNQMNVTEHSHIRRSAVSESERYQDCQRTNIMGSLVQNASPFLFPCTIEYSLICAVILFEMWKQVRSIPEINKMRRSSQKPGVGHQTKSAYHFSIDCSSAHRGMFAGIVVIVLTIICLIMYFVLHEQPEYVNLAIKEVTYYEILLYTVCAIAVLVAFFKMRDLKFHKKSGHGEWTRCDLN